MIEDSLWLITSIIVIIILLIVFPVMHTMEKQDDLVQIQLINEVNLFLHDVKTKGKITRVDYEQLNAKLARLGNYFEVKIEHQKRLFAPIYDDPLNANTFSGKISTVYDLITDQEIVEALYKTGSSTGVYYLNRGDFVTISVNSTLKSKFDRMRDIILLTSSDTPSFFVRLSGMVAHEAY